MWEWLDSNQVKKPHQKKIDVGELINFPSEHNRMYIREQLLKAAKLLIQIETLQAERATILHELGMGPSKREEELF